MTDTEDTPLLIAPVIHKDTETRWYHTFVILALVLAAITGIELVLVYMPFHPIFIFTSLLALSLFKFVAVVAWFMHLIYDKLILTLAFGTGMVIATGTFVALGFLLSRNWVDVDAITQFWFLAFKCVPEECRLTTYQSKLQEEVTSKLALYVL